jgi:transcriptional regulator with XRE-family HTH domain
MVDMEAAGERAMILRRRLEMTQQELADRVGVTQKQISLFETGKWPYVPARVIANIAQVLGLSTDALLGLPDE